MTKNNDNVVWSSNPVIQYCFNILFRNDTCIERNGSKEPYYYTVKFDGGVRSFRVHDDYLYIRPSNGFYTGCYYYDEKYAGLNFEDGFKLYQKCGDVFDEPEKACERALVQEKHRRECVENSLAYLSEVSNKRGNFFNRVKSLFSKQIGQ